MVETDSIIRLTRSMVAERMGELDPSHDMLHVDRVCAMAKHLAEACQTQENPLDLEIVELAALCHDVGDRKYYDGPEEPGLIIARFLTGHGYDTERATLVARIVDNVGYRKELGWDDVRDDPDQVAWRQACRELHVVQDADKLDAIGAFGVMRCAAFSGAKNIPLFEPMIEPVLDMSKDDYEKQTANKTGTAINHFKEKLFKLKGMMRTERAKTIAEKRHAFMHQFVQRVEDEFNMHF